MAKLQIIYDCSDVIEKIIKSVEEHVDMKKDDKYVYAMIENIIQESFNEGRRFQKQISINSPLKESLLAKTDI